MYVCVCILIYTYMHAYIPTCNHTYIDMYVICIYTCSCWLGYLGPHQWKADMAEFRIKLDGLSPSWIVGHLKQLAEGLKEVQLVVIWCFGEIMKPPNSSSELFRDLNTSWLPDALPYTNKIETDVLRGSQSPSKVETLRRSLRPNTFHRAQNSASHSQFIMTLMCLREGCWMA